MRFVYNKEHYTTKLKERITGKVINAKDLSVSTWYKMLLLIEDEFELSKFGWYLIDWKFDGKDNPFMSHSQHILFINTPKKGDKLKLMDPQYTINLFMCNTIDRCCSKITLR